MKIKCTNCGYVETTDKDFFVKLIGGAMPVGGFWAWTTYLFAGTGFAMAIVVAIIGGGVAMLIFKDEIVEWIINNDYKCQKCGEVEWTADNAEDGEVSKSVALSERSKYSISNLKEKPQINKTPAIDLQKRIDIAEELLRSISCEFERKEGGWIVLEQSGELKDINSITELESYAGQAKFLFVWKK